MLEKLILGMDYKTFTQVVILGSSSFVPFMQLSLSDRRSVIENLLGIEIFSAMSQIVKQRATTNREKLELIKADIQLAASKKDVLERARADFSKSNDDKIANLTARIRGYEGELSQLDIDLAAKQLLTKPIDELSNSQRKIDDKIRKADTLIINAESSIRKLKNDIKYLEEHSNCSTCNQNIDAAFRDSSIADFKSKIVNIEAELKEVANIRANYVAQKNAIMEDIRHEAKIGNDISNITFKIRNVKTFIKDTQTEIEETKTKTEYSSSVDSDLERVSQEIVELEKSRIEYLTEKSYISVASNILRENGIKTQIVRVYLPIINNTINHYLTVMGFFASFSLDSEFSETIKSRYIDTMSYNNLSEGEKFRVDLSILLSWRKVAKMKNSVHTNLLVFDEVFDGSLDASGVEEFVKIIWSMENDTNAFVISHKQDQLIDKFSKVYKFEKKKGGWSRLVEV